MKKYWEFVLHSSFWVLMLVYFMQTGFNLIRICKEVVIRGDKVDIESISLRQNKGVNDRRRQMEPFEKKENTDFLFYRHRKMPDCEEFSFYEGQIVLPLSFGLIFKIILFYGFSISLIPHYLAKGKLIHFGLRFGVLGLGLFSLELALDYLYIISRGQAVYPDGFRPNNFNEVQRVQLLWYPIFILLASLYRFTKDWWIHKKIQEQLSQENLQTELNLLKSQINPHFLFNTLNNLYGLALTQKADKTAEGIAKLAQQMRYMLYESNVDWIELEKEVAYIQRFIALQKLRLSEDDKVYIHFEIEGNPQGIKIAPILLLPFVENAFKHGLTLLKATEIQILLQVLDNQLVFKARNTINPNPRSNLESASGLGLQNVKRRLELLYPKKFDLKIQKDELWFEIILQLNL